MIKKMISEEGYAKGGDLVVDWARRDVNSWDKDGEESSLIIGRVAPLLRLLTARLVAERYLRLYIERFPKIRFNITDLERFADNVLDLNMNFSFKQQKEEIKDESSNKINK